MPLHVRTKVRSHESRQGEMFLISHLHIFFCILFKWRKLTNEVIYKKKRGGQRSFKRVNCRRNWPNRCQALHLLIFLLWRGETLRHELRAQPGCAVAIGRGNLRFDSVVTATKALAPTVPKDCRLLSEINVVQSYNYFGPSCSVSLDIGLTYRYILKNYTTTRLRVRCFPRQNRRQSLLTYYPLHR